MKIANNVAGNYGLQNLKNIQPKKPVETPAAKELKPDPVSNEEKQFFVNMYPDKKSELVDYHFYKQSGSMAGVTLGSLFDKRG